VYTLATPEEPNPPFIVNCTFELVSGNSDGTFVIVANASMFRLFVAPNASTGKPYLTLCVLPTVFSYLFRGHLRRQLITQLRVNIFAIFTTV
jgi:hypothetical protein